MKKKIIITAIALIIALIGIISYFVFIQNNESKGINGQEIISIKKADKYKGEINKLGKIIMLNGEQITGKDLKKMDNYVVEATLNVFQPQLEQHKYIAVKLQDLLKLSDSSRRIKVIADDDYTITLNVSDIDSSTFFAIYEIDNDKLTVVNRIFSPKYEPCNWIKNIKSIE